MKDTRQSTKGNFNSDSLQLNQEVNSDLNSNPDRYSGIYREIAEILGDGATLKLWKRFSGLNVTFPQKLFSKEYTKAYIQENLDTMKPSDMAKKLGLSERRVRQLIAEIRNDS